MDKKVQETKNSVAIFYLQKDLLFLAQELKECVIWQLIILYSIIF